MELLKMISMMKMSVRKYGREFDAKKGEHAALASFGSVGTLVEALPLPPEHDADDRNAVTVALIACAAESATPLWTTLLVIAYEPMLQRMAGRATSVARDERAQTVITAFLEAVKAAGKAECTRAPGYLHRATELAVVRGARKDAREPMFVPYDEDTTLADPNDVFRDPFAAREQTETVGKLASSKTRDGDVLRAIAAAAATDQPLSAIIAKAHPTLTEAEQYLLYRRFLRERDRVLGKVRRQLGGGAKPEQASARAHRGAR